MQTFVVRVHRTGGSSGELRGLVDEVASGASATFRDRSELLTILSRSVLSTDGRRGHPETALADEGSA